MRFVTLFVSFVAGLPLGALAGANAGFISFKADPDRHEIRLFLKDANGEPYRQLDRLAQDMTKRGRQLVFATNAGMYMQDLMPLGLFIEEGRTVRPLNERTRANGNFYIQPNGVFFVRGRTARIQSTTDFRRRPAAEKIDFATQSGPLLVIRHQINPALKNANRSRTFRNGVCIDAAGDAIFSLSTHPVTLLDMADYFRTNLHCRDALYLDGGVSQVYWPGEAMEFRPVPLGPMIAVIKKIPD